MSGMIGADPDALDRLAGDFDRGATTLEATATRVRASVHANPWSGARATRFRNDWDQRHGPQLKRTATSLRAAARSLRQQAQEQRQASSAGGLGSPGRAAGGGSRGGAALQDLLDTVRRVGFSAGLVAALGRWNMHQNYPDNYRKVLEALSRSHRIPDLMRFNKSPVLQHLARIGVTDTLKPFSGVLGKAAKGIGGVGTVLDVHRDLTRVGETLAAAESPGDWVRAGTYALDAASDAAMASKAGFLFGVAGKAVALPIREAAKADWSEENRLLVVDEIARDPTVLATAFGSATVTVGQTFASWFVPIPAGVKDD